MTAPAEDGTTQTTATVDAPAAGTAQGGSGSAAIDRIDALQAQVAERDQDLLRARADFANYRRRRDREAEAAREQALVAFATDLLPVLDDVDRAREHEQISPGFRSVAEGLERMVTRAGLAKFGTPGDPFDPTVHEALVSGYSEEVDRPTATVIVQAGYRVGDRVVRPARVMVMDAPPGGGAGAPVEGGVGQGEPLLADAADLPSAADPAATDLPSAADLGSAADGAPADGSGEVYGGGTADEETTNPS